MHKKIAVVAFTLFLLPAVTFAHEVRMYEINGVEYEMVVGSLNEPVIVDDKTGVSIEIVRDGAFLTGAQDMLQVEMTAGDTSRVVNLEPVHGYEGSYKAPFIATVPTTLTYRFFGELEGTPVDLTFTCNPAGHPQAAEDTSRTDISEGVVQTLKRGAFGCPQPKEAFGFPEEAPSEVTLAQNVGELSDMVTENEDQNGTSGVVGLVAILLSLLALGLVYKNRR